jgi:aspartyl-tRNA(Asn)/glutamyl-tRNA(Gln) amidotransferase subunit C
MARKFSDEDVARIAALARIDVAPDEIAMFSRQLDDILTYVETLQQVETTGIEPTSHPLPLDPLWREDEPRPSLDRTAVLEHAPATTPRTGLFKVPKVL